MSEIEKIILTSCFTILGGILIFSMGQMISRFFIDPVHEQFKGIGNIAFLLGRYANVYCNPGPLYHPMGFLDKVADETRQSAMSLVSSSNSINLYGFWEKLGFIINRSDVSVAVKQLIGLSNSVHKGNGVENYERMKKIEKLLKFKISTVD